MCYPARVQKRFSLQRTSALPHAEKELLRRLEEVLSDPELRRVLAAALLELNPAGRKRLLARLDPETSEALVAVFSPPKKQARPREPASVTPGKGKLRQEWVRLWQEWAQVVSESGDEEGKYVQQDAEWEAPYLVPTAIAADLDEIAGRMQGLIPLVIGQSIAPGFSFADALREMNDGLYAGLPEWINEGDDSCYLGPKTTACLIEWEWTLARRLGQDTATFLDGLRDLETRLTKVALDHATITKFVFRLSEAELRGLLASMVRQRRSARWVDAFSQAHGCWAEILRKLSKRWDPALFAETSRANIQQNWTLALPLIEAAIRRKAFAEASELIDEAVRSKLQLNGDEPWDPRKELFVQRGRFVTIEEQRPRLARLLGRWQEVAQALGQQDLAAALGLQIVALEKAEDAERMLKAFREIPPQFQATSDALFAAWRALVVQRTFGLWGKSTLPCGDWLPALVDAARAGEAGAASFHAAVRASLAKAVAEEEAKPSSARTCSWLLPHRMGPRDCLPALAVLTRDLDATASTFSESAPRLWRLLPKQDSGERDHFGAARRRWCKLLGGQELVPEIVAFWRDHAIRFVPNPGVSTSDYSESAKWLAAVHEVNPKAASDLLARWAATHGRKRNLWRDLASQGIALPPGVRRS